MAIILLALNVAKEIGRSVVVLIRMLSLRNLCASASWRLIRTESLLTAEAPKRRDYVENWKLAAGRFSHRYQEDSSIRPFCHLARNINRSARSCCFWFFGANRIQAVPRRPAYDFGCRLSPNHAATCFGPEDGREKRQSEDSRHDKLNLPTERG